MKILYEDAVMLAAVKPQGMPAQADKTGDLDLLSALEEYTGQPLGLLHRLDRPVGGVMLFAKEKRAEAFLAKEIQEHRLKKAYLTVLCGRLPAAEGGLEDYLLKNADKVTMPRKLKVGFSNSPVNVTHATFRDLGFVAAEDGTFTVYSADLGGNRAENRQASPDSRADGACRRAHLGG